MAVNIEDAGFEIRDLIAWVYGSGFPKSLDISKAIDKAAGAEREIKGRRFVPDQRGGKINSQATAENGIVKYEINITAPATDAAKEWEGWGTALKPALEPITVARKPIETTVAANVLKYGTGGLNIDGARVEAGNDLGRWPANLIHDGSEDVLKLFPDSISSGGENSHNGAIWGTATGQFQHFNDSGSAARFFYCPKASKSERDNGLKGFEPKTAGVGALRDGGRESEGRGNFHPTVKPVDLMRYLVKLVTPKGGTVLDPFNGSGTTGVACKLENFNYVGLEFDPEYCKISRARIENYEWNPAPEPEPIAPNQLNLFE
jgi:site-specific DNA-methyltransferase (adenine-specific)